MLIRTGHVSIRVDSLEPAMAQLRALATSLGGVVGNVYKGRVQRVMPGMQYCPEDVHSSPRLTIKKWVELHVATKPRGSSIKASSAPALAA